MAENNGSESYIEQKVPGSFDSVDENVEHDLFIDDFKRAQQSSMYDQFEKSRGLNTPIQTEPSMCIREPKYPVLDTGDLRSIRDSRRPIDSAASEYEDLPSLIPLESKLSNLPEAEVSLDFRLAEAFETAEKLEKSRAECDALRKQVNDLTRNLQEQEDFIFSLQPHRETFTGSEAAIEFKSLCGSIENWVMTTLGDAIDDRKLEKHNDFPEKQAREFMQLLSQASCDALTASDTDVYQVISFIMRFLDLHIFQQDPYFDWHLKRVNVINELQKSMDKLQPRRELAAQRFWRSEALTAFANSPNFSFHRAKMSNNLSIQLSDTLSIFLPYADKHIFTKNIQDAIVEPSLILAHKMQLSIDKFSLQWSPLQRMEPKARPDDPRKFEPFDPLDITGRTLKFPAAAEGAAGKGYIIYLFDLFPKLMFESVKGDSFREPQVLKKAKILVVATKEHEGPFIIPKLLPGRSTTLTGWLDQTLVNRSRKQSGWKERFL